MSWRSPDTAPRDGTEFWAISDGSVGVFPTWWIEEAEAFFCQDGETYPITPTGWQPMHGSKPLHPKFAKQ